MSSPPVEDDLRYHILQQIEQNLISMGYKVDIEIIDPRREKLFPVDAKINIGKIIGLQFKRPEVKSICEHKFKLKKQQHKHLQLYAKNWFFYAFPSVSNRAELVNALCRTTFVDPSQIPVIGFKPLVTVYACPIPIFQFSGSGCKKSTAQTITICQNCPFDKKSTGKYVLCIGRIITVQNGGKNVARDSWPCLRCEFVRCNYGSDPKILDFVERFIRENVDSRLVFITIDKKFKRIVIFVAGGEVRYRTG